MKTTKLKAPRRVKIGGRTFWQVETPRPEGGRQRKTFRSRDDARVFHERAKAALAKFGSAAMALDEKQRGDALRALAILKPHGMTLLDAAREAVARATELEGGKPLAEAVRMLLDAKRGAGLSVQYVSDLRLRLRRLTDALPDATTTSVTTREIDGFLRGLNLHPTTANTFRRDINTLFNWCIGADLCRTNPAAKTSTFKAAPAPITSISSDQFATLLNNAPPCILPAFVLGGFAALRQSEIARLDWSAIDLREGIVTLDASATKTASRRVVMLPRAAVAWLEPLARPSGRVLTRNAETRAAWYLTRMSAGFGVFRSSLLKVRQATEALTEREKEALKPWPENALRHSAISARLALAAADAAAAFGVSTDAALSITDISSVAFQAGNSPQVIRSNYLKLTKPSNAKKWFKVLPPKPAKNILQLRKQA